MSFNSLVSLIDSAPVAAQEVGSGNAFLPDALGSFQGIAKRRRLDREATIENDQQNADAQFEKATAATLAAMPTKPVFY